MAQTTGQMSFADAKVEIKIAAGAWVDIGGEFTKIEVDGGERKSGEAFTQTGDTPVLTKGKREKYTVKGSVVYTEGTTTPWKLLWDAHKAGSDVQVRWSPKGGSTGDYQFSSAATGNVLKNVTPPVGEASNGDPIMSEFSLETADITDAAIVP
ncbi:MAG: hypothetical protein PHQ36_05850 [Anaerolineales bacterium]|nr:hypothetical protein [Anaerolineales bacterium]